MKLKLVMLALLAFSLNSYGADLQKQQQAENVFKKKFDGILGGTNTGGAWANASNLINWCRGTTGRLQFSLEESDTPLLIRNSAEEAFVVLRKGLIQASQVPPGTVPDHTLMYVAVQRGLEIADALKAPDMANTLSPEGALWVMRQYYSFLINKVSAADVDYYIPYFNCVGCTYDANQEKQFEERFVTYSHEALAWLNEEFLNFTHEKGAIPRSSPKLFLKLAAYMVSNAVTDLTNPNSIWQNKYACIIENLKMLQQSIIEHNLGDMSHYGDDRIAVNKISARVRGVQNEFFRINGRLNGQPMSGGFCR
jgi:hypothetical protein